MYGEKFGDDLDPASGGALGISGRHIFSYVYSWQPNSKQLETDVVRKNTETAWRKDTEECVRSGWGWGKKEEKRERRGNMNEVREDHALALDSISLSVSGCSFIILSPPPISFPSLQDYSCHHTYCYFSHHKSKQANKNQLLDPTPFPYSPSQQNSRKTFLYSLPPIPLSSHSFSNARQSGFCLPTIL